jgi:hypothetical protein
MIESLSIAFSAAVKSKMGPRYGVSEGEWYRVNPALLLKGNGMPPMRLPSLSQHPRILNSLPVASSHQE